MFGLKKKQEDINLIPEAQKSLKAAKLKLVVTLFLVMIVGLLIVIGAVLISLNFTEGQKAKKLSSELDENLSQWQQVAGIAQKAAGVKAKTTQISDVADSNEIFTTALTKVRSHVPTGVKLKSLSIKSTDTLSLQATSDNSAEMHQFVNNLKADQEFFETVNVGTLTKSSEGYILNLDLKVKSK